MIVNQGPKEISLSHNPIVYSFSSNHTGLEAFPYAFIQRVGAYSSGSITINGVLFTVDNNQNESRFFSDEAFVLIFNDTQELNYKYSAYLSGNVIVIQSKYSGPKYNLTIAVDQFAVLTNVSGVAATFADAVDNYGVFVNLFDGGDQVTKIATLQKNYQASNVYNFDLSGILKTLLKAYKPLATSTAFQYTQSIRLFNIQYGEMYGSDFRAKHIIGTDIPRWMMLGMLPGGEYQEFISSTDWAFGSFKILTTIAEDKKTSSGGIEFLSVFNVNSAASLRIIIVTHFIDGTTSTVTKDSSIYNLGTITIRVDPDAVLTTTEDVLFYTVQPIMVRPSVANVNYETLTYRFAENSYIVYTLAFLNNLGVYDTFTFTNSKKVDAKANRKYIQTGRTEVDYTKGTKFFQTNDIDYQEEIEYFSNGLIDFEINLLKKLVKSSDVYLIDSGEYVPLKIIDSSYEKSTEDDLFFFSIKVVVAQPETILI